MHASTSSVTRGLRDNQDTLLDDAHFASAHLELDLHRFWLERAVPGRGAPRKRA